MNRLLIIMYHAIVQRPLAVSDWCFFDERSLRRNLQELTRYFEVTSLEEGISRLSRGEICQPTVAITFDDGFQNNHDVAFPVLLESRIPATIFPVTGLVGTSDTLWFCRLNKAIAGTKLTSFEWNGRTYDLSSNACREASSAKLQEHLKFIPHPEALTVLRRIICELGDDPYEHIDADSPYRMLSRRSIEDMTKSGLIEFGAHTHSHAILRLLPLDRQRSEISKSVAHITEWTGRHCRLFAYPNGRLTDFDHRTVALARAWHFCGRHGCDGIQRCKNLGNGTATMWYRHEWGHLQDQAFLLSTRTVPGQPQTLAQLAPLNWLAV